MERSANNFTAVRIVGGFIVLLRHSFILVGDDAPEAISMWFVEPIGIWIFFAASGYLLPAAWARNPRPFRYVVNRLSRVIPGLTVVVVVSAFVIGPLVTTLSRSEYFTHPFTWSYLSNIAFLPAYQLPGVFTMNPVSSAVNGSLWSLPPLFACYLIVPVVGLIRERSVRGVLWAAFSVLSAILWSLGVGVETIVWGSRVSEALAVAVVFFGAAALRELRVPLSIPVAAALAIILVCVMAWLPAYDTYALWIAVPYIAITIGSRSTPILRRAGRFGDPSFGLFLWGFPIQQTLLVLTPNSWNAWTIPMTAAVCLAIAYASWHFVEKPSNSLVRKWTPKALS